MERAPNVCFLAQPASPNLISRHIEEQESDASAHHHDHWPSGKSRSIFFMVISPKFASMTAALFLKMKAASSWNILRDKWGAHIANENDNWTRVGLLPDPPERKNDAWPLSDQSNTNGVDKKLKI